MTINLYIEPAERILKYSGDSSGSSPKKALEQVIAPILETKGTPVDVHIVKRKENVYIYTRNKAGMSNGMIDVPIEVAVNLAAYFLGGGEEAFDDKVFNDGRRRITEKYEILGNVYAVKWSFIPLPPFHSTLENKVWDLLIRFVVDDGCQNVSSKSSPDLANAIDPHLALAGAPVPDDAKHEIHMSAKNGTNLS